MQLLCYFLFALIWTVVSTFKIEGKVAVPTEATLSETIVLVDDGDYKGFLR